MNVREKLIANGVANLKEFGYAHCNETNILTVPIFKAFFEEMLQENLGQNPQIDIEINKLLAEIEVENSNGAENGKEEV